jgi:hypothetical protein
MTYYLKVIQSFVLLSLSLLALSQEIKEESILSEGTWLKVYVTEQGVVRINYQDISSLNFSSGLPEIYGNNNGLLSFRNDGTAPDDLIQIPVFLEAGADNMFNQGDYLLFYNEGTHRWIFDGDSSYSFIRHIYSDTAVYFIRSGSSHRQIPFDDEAYSPGATSLYGDHLYIHEVEKQNILKSGREWYQPVSSLQPVTIPAPAAGSSFEPGTGMRYSLRVLARSSNPTLFRLSGASGTISSTGVEGINILNTTGTYARLVVDEGETEASDAGSYLSVSFHNNGDNSARGWLDYLQIHSRVRHSYTGTQKVISDFRSVGHADATTYSITASAEGIMAWDVTDSRSPVALRTTVGAGNLSVTLPSDTLRRIALFRLADAVRPVRTEGPLPNQNLHAAGGHDMIIVSHPLFLQHAEELASLHAEHNGYSTIIVTPQQIYNEFSGGIPDISAIRNFTRMIRNRGLIDGTPLKNLLLFGDGSYDNITPPPGNPCFIPTYQTRNSHINILSFTSDDYFGLLDPGEGESDGTIDIGIGRLPAASTEEADALVTKIRRYYSPGAAGSWRNIITLAADDEDGNLHMSDAEALAEVIAEYGPAFNINKIYFDSYPQETSINGDAYPAATAAINDRINNGTLIFNYLGHGNELGLAHERVVKIEDINSWSNTARLALFITATCEFSRYDDIDTDPATGAISRKISAGEMALLNPSGGAVALLTTTRIVYSAPNFTLNNQIYKHLFTRSADGRALTLGEIVRLAKNSAGSGDNKRSFTLLGDPALTLSYPWNGVAVVDSVNGRPAETFTDTLNALSTVQIDGYLAGNEGEDVQDFTGMADITLYDKSYPTVTQANDGGLAFPYTLSDRILFKGKAPVTNGRFKLTFMIPRDIDYSYGNARISLYASDGIRDFAGIGTIMTGGFSNFTVTDTTGPEIRLFLNDTLFRNGGISGDSPVLLALIRDPGGINTTGVGIGHDLMAWFDNSTAETRVLNSFFEYDPGSYTSGSVTYPLSGLSPGGHTIKLKAWDNFNNSATGDITFVVRGEKGIILDKLINFPNPFKGSTSVTVEHNRPGIGLKIRIDIFSSGGRHIRSIVVNEYSSGYRTTPVIWDGRSSDNQHVAAGIYPYRVTITTENGETEVKSGRMVIMK